MDNRKEKIIKIRGTVRITNRTGKKQIRGRKNSIKIPRNASHVFQG